MPILQGSYSAPVHMIKLTRDAGDHAVSVGGSGRGEVSASVHAAGLLPLW
jgi:hypothetical protein